MKDEHNIDRLFQESFKDFEVDAPKEAWRNIETRLTQNTKTRIFPLWQKISGAAALIAILILAGSQWFMSPDVNNSIVDTPNNEMLDDQATPNRTVNPRFVNPNTQNINSNAVVLSGDDDQNSNSAVSLSGENSNVVKPKVSETNPERAKSPQGLASNLSLMSIGNNLNTTKSNPTKSIPYNQNTGYEPSTSSSNFGSNGYSLISSLNSKELVRESQIYLKANSINLENNTVVQPKQKSLVEVAAQINNEKLALKDKKEKSWFVKPQLSPVFYGNLGSGSSIDQNFNQNSAQGEVNVSYGLNVAYKINEKIKVRTGINRVNLNYNTNDVFVLSSSGFSSINNVDVVSSFQNSVITRTQLNALEESQTLLRLPTEESQLQQQLGYIEVPMELEYKLLDKAIDINIIGGASTLLLNDNSLDIQTGNDITFLGEANNVNNLSFTTNLAIGLGYDISDRLLLNLEPTFKYQLNTFQSGTTDFQPYFIGVYSGVVFKF